MGTIRAERIDNVRSLLSVFEEYFNSLLSEETVLRHCVRDLSGSQPVSVFLKESFLVYCPPKVFFCFFLFLFFFFFDTFEREMGHSIFFYLFWFFFFPLK